MNDERIQCDIERILKKIGYDFEKIIDFYKKQNGIKFNCTAVFSTSYEDDLICIFDASVNNRITNIEIM